MRFSLIIQILILILASCGRPYKDYSVVYVDNDNLGDIITEHELDMYLNNSTLYIGVNINKNKSYPDFKLNIKAISPSNKVFQEDIILPMNKESIDSYKNINSYLDLEWAYREIINPKEAGRWKFICTIDKSWHPYLNAIGMRIEKNE